MSLTDHQSQEALRRDHLCERATAMMKKDNMSLNQCARALGEPVANLHRFLKKYKPGGFDSLAPRQAGNSGRKAKFSLTDDEARALQLWVLKKGSLALAVEFFADDSACLPGTRVLILEEMDRAARTGREAQWPPSIRRAAHVSPEEEALFRGPKAFQNVEFCQRRGMFYELGGVEHPMDANAIWESDDMSLNEPFCFRDPHTREAQVGRQTLCTMDVYAAAWLGASPIGRERDAYRVEDIADHMLETVLQHGLPRIWRLERGPWENNFIDGIEIDGRDTRWGGLDALFHIARTWKSRGKGTIESSFNFLQSLIAHESTSIGRKRGEFEAATKAFLKAGRGDPGAASKFWEIEEAADALQGAMGRFNSRPKRRRSFAGMVVPNDLYRPETRRECPPDQLWRFCPVKREATVRGGHVEMCVDHYPLKFRFQVCGVTPLYLEQGYRVLVAFHPGRPEEGCHVFNAETGTKNRDNFRFAEPLLVAPLAEDAPQVSIDPAQREFMARKNANAAVRSSFRGIVAAGARGHRSRTARDGWGNVATERNQAGAGVERHEVASRGGEPGIAGNSGGGGDRINRVPGRPIHSIDEEAAITRSRESGDRIKAALRESGALMDD
jgi:hypothetical protein